MEYIRIIIDVAVAVIVLLTVLLGVKRGFVKTCLGLIYVLLAIVITAMATSPLTQVVMTGTDWSDSLQKKLEESLVEDVPNAYALVFYDEIDSEHEGKELIYEDASGNRLPFSTIMDDNKLIKSLGIAELIEPSAEELLAAQAEEADIPYDDVNNTIALIDAVTLPLTSIIVTVVVGVCVFILSLIVLRLLLWLIGALVKRLYLVHFLDKLLGGIFGLVLGLLFIFIVLAVIKLMGNLDFMEPVMGYIENTVLTKFLMDNNIVYTLLIDNLHLDTLFGAVSGGGNA